MKTRSKALLLTLCAVLLVTASVAGNNGVPDFQR